MFSWFIILIFLSGFTSAFQRHCQETAYVIDRGMKSSFIGINKMHSIKITWLIQPASTAAITTLFFNYVWWMISGTASPSISPHYLTTFNCIMQVHNLKPAFKLWALILFMKWMLAWSNYHLIHKLQQLCVSVSITANSVMTSYLFRIKLTRYDWLHLDGLVHERCKSIANTMELHLSCTNPSNWCDNSYSLWQRNLTMSIPSPF